MIKACKSLFSKIDARDVVGVSGLGMLFYGTFLVSQPAAFVVVGGIMTLIAVRGV